MDEVYDRSVELIANYFLAKGAEDLLKEHRGKSGEEKFQNSYDDALADYRNSLNQFESKELLEETLRSNGLAKYSLFDEVLDDYC